MNKTLYTYYLNLVRIFSFSLNTIDNITLLTDISRDGLNSSEVALEGIIGRKFGSIESSEILALLEKEDKEHVAFLVFSYLPP